MSKNKRSKPTEPFDGFKSISIHDLMEVKPKTEAQKNLFTAYCSGFHLNVLGTAGTGKTFLSMYLALRDVLEGKYNKLLIVRSSVATRDLGHLPGDLSEKLKVYEAPYRYIIRELFPDKQEPYEQLLGEGMIEFASTSYMRGRTYNNTIILNDESQNSNFHELDSLITRVGDKSKIIFCGDTAQTDLIKYKNDSNGLDQFSRILDAMKEIATITFTRSDIVRSGLVKSYIIEKEEIQYEKEINC